MDGICEFAPLVVFAYNRPIHLKRCLESVNNNPEAEKTDLNIFIDAPTDINDNDLFERVKRVVKDFVENNRFKKVSVHMAEEHMGLSKSVIFGVDEIINDYKKVIVLEDDLIVSNDFLKYMNDALNYYEAKDSIWSISGYSPNMPALRNYSKDVYMCKRAGSWGWATWKNRWDSVIWDENFYKEVIKDGNAVKQFRSCGHNLPEILENHVNKKADSWAVRFCYCQCIQGKLTVNPTISRVKNIGFDGSGTHKPIKAIMQKVKLNEEYKEIKFEEPVLNKINEAFFYYFSGNVLRRYKRLFMWRVRHFSLAWKH